MIHNFYLRSKIEVDNSEDSFTFGDGRTFKSVKRVTIPWTIDMYV